MSLSELQDNTSALWNFSGDAGEVGFEHYTSADVISIQAGHVWKDFKGNLDWDYPNWVNDFFTEISDCIKFQGDQEIPLLPTDLILLGRLLKWFAGVVNFMPDIERPQILPAGDGGAMLHWDTDDYSLEVSISANGNISWAFEDTDGTILPKIDSSFSLQDALDRARANH